MKQRILEHLPQGHPWSSLIQVHDTLDSTNSYAKNLARQGAVEGTAVLAQTQLAGRGRLGRSFHSPAGLGLYLSVVLRPQCPPAELMHLTCAAGVAACDAVQAVCGLRPGIKWINDLVLDGKKLGGILTELAVGADGLVEYAVVGIGINCTHKEADFPAELQKIACSLKTVTGNTPDIGALVAALLVTLERMRKDLAHRGQIMDRYRADCITAGKPVRVISPTEVRNATAKQVNDDGSLSVIYEDGQTDSVNSGEVSVRGLWDYL